MRLHEDKTLFRQAVQFTSDLLRILAIYVEKDYWVTYALFTIYSDDIGKDTVFKGGTALSKCFNLIDRFSEDIDLVILRRAGESNNQLTNKIRKIGTVVNNKLQEVTIESLTQKMGMNRKTAHIYNKEFTGNYAQVRDFIVVEATWLGNSEPYTTKRISSFVGDMMVNNGQIKLAKDNGLLPFELLALEPTRTICEKIMSLVRFSYGSNPLEDLKKKVRHTYDLHQLLSQKEYSAFIASQAFEKMLLKVGNDGVASFKNNNSWLVNHPKDSFIFNNLDDVWDELKEIYGNDFRKLVYGNFPEETSVLATLKLIQERLNSVNWDIKV